MNFGCENYNFFRHLMKDLTGWCLNIRIFNWKSQVSVLISNAYDFLKNIGEILHGLII